MSEFLGEINQLTFAGSNLSDRQNVFRGLPAASKNYAQRLRKNFRQFSIVASRKAGSPGAFLMAIAFVVVWAMSGFLFEFSNTWQLIVNTVTTIITFLMVFPLQNSQNRDAKVINQKLDQLLEQVRAASEVQARRSEEVSAGTVTKEARGTAELERIAA